LDAQQFLTHADVAHLQAVRANLDEANRIANGSGSEKAKIEARVEVGVLEALQYALK
jgi:F-type H+-transporting ATPase subunit delta